MQYKKLIHRKKLIQFWIFYSGSLKSTFKINYQFLTLFYNDGCFLDFKNLSFYIKKLLPLFLDSMKNKEQFLFVATTGIYSKNIISNSYLSFVKNLNRSKSGLFTNFSAINFQVFTKFKLKLNPSVLILFYFNEPNFLIFEAKKKKIPLVGLINTQTNSNLLDYPITINPVFFYNIYFFSKFFFKLILKYKL
jgi:ribosomal protein S2